MLAHAYQQRTLLPATPTAATPQVCITLGHQIVARDVFSSSSLQRVFRGLIAGLQANTDKEILCRRDH
jgi:hypothetical protein